MSEHLDYPQTKELFPFIIKNESHFIFLQGYAHKLLARMLESIHGEKEIFLSLTLDTINVDPGVNVPDLNYSIELSLIGVTNTIREELCIHMPHDTNEVVHELFINLGVINMDVTLDDIPS